VQQDLIELNHYELCKVTAERFFKNSDVVLYEYNCMRSNEMPDVLCYKNGYTELYEIKVSVANFKADAKKDCRVKYKTEYWPTWKTINGMKKPGYVFKAKPVNIEKPHLGKKRYYVCPAGMIQPEEVERWGLYWVKNGRFYKKKESEIFVRNIFLELTLLSHALRQYAAGIDKNILIKPYYNGE
jgi:hypothetical protein